MSKDLIGALNDEWWSNANSADKWKPKYECMKEIFNVLTGNEETNVEVKCDISDHKKANDLMKILTNWLVNENHIFTRIAILRVMPKLIQAFPKKTIGKYQNQLLETILTKQWTEKKKVLLDLVTPCLIPLWLKTGVELKSDEFKPFLVAALKHRGKEARFSACDFLAKATMFPKRKKQIMELCQDKEIGPLLGKLSMGDKEKTVKLAGCKAMHGLHEMGVMKGKKVSKELANQYDQLLNNKRGKKNLDAAVAEYKAEVGGVAAQDTGGDDEKEEKEEKKPKKCKKCKKGKKCKKCKKAAKKAAQAAEEKKEPPAAPVTKPAGGGDGLGDDEKMEGGKKYKRVIKKVKKEVPKAGSGKEFSKGIGGILSPEGVEKKKNKAKKPKKVEEGKPIDSKSLEDNRKALDAATKFKAVNAQNAFKKLDKYCKDDLDSLKKTAKITERVKALEPIAADIKKDGKWDDIYDSIIGLASETMGWDGNDARNPMLAKMILSLISDAMSNTKGSKKDSGSFTIYLKWALERLSENKFNKLATECLLSTCYQYSPKVVFSVIEKYLFEPEDPAKDPFKNDKGWAPIVKFIGDAVTQFGVDSFYVCRLINIIHQKMPKAKNKDSKEACYSSLTALYQQLGPSWADVLLGPCSKQSKKTVDKKFKKCVNPGTYKQLRCTKKESVPAPSGVEMEIIEEEVEEWVEIIENAPQAVQPQAQEVKQSEPEPEPEVKQEEEGPQEPEPEPEPEPTPPPPPGPLESDTKGHKYRLNKCKKLIKLWEQSKNLDKSLSKEYDSQISPKKVDKNHPGVFNDSPGDDYKCGDIEKWKGVFIDKKSTVKKWKPIVASLCSWISNFEGTKFFNDIVNCTDLMLYWANAIYIENAQPNVGKMMMDLWKQLMESYAGSYVQLGEVEGKMILPIVANQCLGAKNTKDLGMELCEAIEHVYPPAICYKIYLTTMDKTKSNMVKLNCMIRLNKAITDYGLVKCDAKKFKLKCKPFASPKDFVKTFMKQYFKLKDKKTIEAGKDILKFCYEVVGDKGFWKECKLKGSQKEDVEKIVEDADKFKKGKYRKPEKQWIGDLIKQKKKEEARLKALAEQNGGVGGGIGGIDGGIGGGIGDNGLPVPPQAFPGKELSGFTPLRFTPQQLLALKYGPAPHSWKMNNFSSYVSRLPPAFCMDWEEFEREKTTVSTKPIAPYIKIGNVRIDVETGKEITNDGGVNAYASMPPNNQMGVGPTGMNIIGNNNNEMDIKREAEEKEFLMQTQKDDEIMSSILGVERDNAEYFDTNNDGSSWLALYDVNGFDETDRQIQLIEMRNIYGVKTLQTWLHTGKNVSIVESSVNKLLSVLLPWLRDWINTETLLPDNQRYEQTYQILQLLKFCSKFKTLKGLNKSELILFFKVLLSSITYDNINALFGHNYKRILGEINDVLIKSIYNTPPTDTLCVLISLLKECDPTNDSQSTKQYADASCKLIYKVIKKYDKIICQNSDRVINVYCEIVKFFSTISFETWQMAEAQRRFPLKIMQMVIARLVWFCGNNSATHLNAAIEKLQHNNKPNTNNNININNAAIHQRDTYAKRLIMNFIHACENRRLMQRPNASVSQGNRYQSGYQQDEDEKNKPHNIKQAQSSTNNYMQPSSAEYQAKSTLQNVHDANKEAAQYAKENKIDLNFALWVGMTGRNKHDYIDPAY